MEYHTIEDLNKKRKFIHIFSRSRSAKPVVKKIKKEMTQKEFYEKYGIIYEKNIAFSCVNSLF